MDRGRAPIDDAPGTRRTTPRPLLTSIALLVTGLVTLGAAALVLPKIGARTGPATPEVERVQVPQAALQRTLDAGTQIGGVDIVPSREAESAPPAENVSIAPSARSSETLVSEAPPAHGPSSTAKTTPMIGGNVGTNVAAATGVTTSSSAMAAPATSGSAIGGGPPAAPGDAGVATTGDGGIELGEGGVLGEAGSGIPYVTPILAAPVYGAPPSSTSNGPPTIYGAAGDAAPLWVGGGSTTSSGGGGGGGGNSGVVNPRPSIATSFLLTMNDTDDPERAWTSLTPYLRPNDVVVAHLGGAAGPNDAAYLDWGDRVRVDTPLVQYVLAVDDASSVNKLLARGVPANVNAIGPARTDGVDANTMNALSSAAHAVGKKFFASVSSASPVPLAQVASRVDIVELVLLSSDPTAAVSEASKANAQLHGGGAPTLFVRLPSGVTSNTAAGDFIGALQSAVPNVGVSVPYGTSSVSLGDLRSTP